jgi:Ala-tRNA(Pro) deacylase
MGDDLSFEIGGVVMVPEPIRSYLEERGVPFRTIEHPYGVSAQQTAIQAHVSGKRFGKTVVLKRNGRYLILVIPADELVDFTALREQFGDGIVLATERELTQLFPDCETGAMPPLGELYGLPVVIDASFAKEGTIAVNGGTHTDVIELRWDEFVRSEHPRIIAH